MDTPAASIEFIIIFILIIVNAFFALIETAIKESHKTKLEKLSESGNRHVKAALQMVERPNKTLATIQIGITLTGLFIGALTGAKAAPLFANYLQYIPYLSDYRESLSLCFSAMIIIYLVLVFGELIPKKIADDNPEPIVIRFAGLLNGLETLARPLVTFLSISTNFILLFVGVNPNKETSVTEEEVRTLIEQGTEEGTFEKTEQAMVDRIFRLSDQNAYSLMTPRTQLLWLDLEDSLEHNLSLIMENPDTVFLVGKDSLDDFSGILYAKDLLKQLLEKKPLHLEKCVHKPMFIPKSMEAFKVLEHFKAANRHEAVVLDEFGGVVGFITMKDIISEVVGDLSFNDEEDDLQMVPTGENTWLIDGLLPIDDFKDHFDIEELPDEERDHYQTMGGFATSFLGYIPTVAEKFTWGDFTFEILNMDRVRIDKILVRKKNMKKDAEENLAS